MSAAAYADCMRFAYGGIRGVGRGSRPRVGPSRRLNRAPGGASRAPGGGLTPKCCVPTRGLTREAPGVPEGGGPRGYNLADMTSKHSEFQRFRNARNALSNLYPKYYAI